MESKWQKLAKFLVGYSTRVEPGDICLIKCTGSVNEDLVSELIDAIFAAGGQPLIWQEDPGLMRQIVAGPSDEALTILMTGRLEQIKKAQCVFGLYAEDNACELAGLSEDRLQLYNRLREPISNWYCNHTRRITTVLPNKAMAQLAGMSTKDFDRFYFDVCLGVDYEAMSRAMDALVERMQKTDQVRIVGPYPTDITFSIKGIPAIKCAGRENLPDGEVFTAPVRDSVNGYIAFNTPTVYDGNNFGPMTLGYKQGFLHSIQCSKFGDLEKAAPILHTDAGAEFIGEFAFGLNPKITRPTGEILFDEKIVGSIHLTPGSCYAEASNGNDKSAIHWDMILRQTPEFGGGEIYFDNKLIRKDGLFLGDLAGLNPENLVV